MTSSLTSTQTTTFTLTHAKHLAAKVITDLKRMQRFYGSPNNSQIDLYQEEITLLLKDGYLEEVGYGFQVENNWIPPSFIYTASELSFGDNSDPGKVKADIILPEGATFNSFLTFSTKWSCLSQSEKSVFEQTLPFTRTTGTKPGVTGYLSSDHSYLSGGRALSRSSVRSFS